MRKGAFDISLNQSPCVISGGVRKQLVNTCCADCVHCQVCQPPAVEVLIENLVDTSCCNFIVSAFQYSWKPINLASALNGLGWLTIPVIMSGDLMTCQYEATFELAGPTRRQYYFYNCVDDCEYAIRCDSEYTYIRVLVTLTDTLCQIIVLVWRAEGTDFCELNDCAGVLYGANAWEYVFLSNAPAKASKWCFKTEEIASPNQLTVCYSGGLYYPCPNTGQVTVRKR